MPTLELKIYKDATKYTITIGEQVLTYGVTYSPFIVTGFDVDYDPSSLSVTLSYGGDIKTACPQFTYVSGDRSSVKSTLNLTGDSISAVVPNIGDTKPFVITIKDDDNVYLVADIPVTRGSDSVIPDDVYDLSKRVDKLEQDQVVVSDWVEGDTELAVSSQGVEHAIDQLTRSLSESAEASSEFIRLMQEKLGIIDRESSTISDIISAITKQGEEQ